MPRGQLTPEQMARKLAALASPETKAKMRAAKLGRSQSPEHVAKRVAAQVGKPLSEEHRRKISDAQKGRPLRTEHRLAMTAAHRTPESRAKMSAAQKRAGRTPAQVAALKEWNANKRGPMPDFHREAIADGQARAYAEGRRTYTTLERRASWLLLPLGFTPWVRIGRHVFDFAKEGVVVEVNGCRWHDHKAIKPECKTTSRPGVFAADEAYRAIARAKRLKLIELWACEEALWPKLIGIPALDA